MQYRGIDHQGSFTAQGVGFLYEYHAPGGLFSASRAAAPCGGPVLVTRLTTGALENPFEFTRFLDKTARIKAFHYTSGETEDLSGAFDDFRLSGILEAAGRFAAYACDLQAGRFDDFRSAFLSRKKLRDIRVGHAKNQDMFHARVETMRRSETTAFSCNVHGALHHLSESISIKAIDKEFCDSSSILTVAHALSMLSLLLNERFEPACQALRSFEPVDDSSCIYKKTV